jgi:hypothetical protein
MMAAVVVLVAFYIYQITQLLQRQIPRLPLVAPAALIFLRRHQTDQIPHLALVLQLHQKAVDMEVTTAKVRPLEVLVEEEAFFSLMVLEPDLVKPAKAILAMKLLSLFEAVEAAAPVKLLRALTEQMEAHILFPVLLSYMAAAVEVAIEVSAAAVATAAAPGIKHPA